MVGREVPFYPEDTCDICGKLGAYDFMGDCFCPECIEKLEAEAEEAEKKKLDGDIDGA